MPSLCGPGHMGKSSKHLDRFLRWKSYFSLQFHPSEDFNREQRETNARKKYQASGRPWELQSSIPKLANTAELLRTLSTPNLITVENEGNKFVVTFESCPGGNENPTTKRRRFSGNEHTGREKSVGKRMKLQTFFSLLALLGM